MKKLRMRADDLRVDSFPTAPVDEPTGTVRGQDEGCTWDESCLCDTAYYQCGTGPETIFSCDYTVVYPCRRTAFECPDTSYQVCGTAYETRVC